MRKIAVSNEKGGTGKTTTAVTLAHGLVLSGNGKRDVRTLLIDLDAQGNTRRALGVGDIGLTIADVLLGRSSWTDAIIEVRPNLHLIPSGPELAEAKEELLDRLTLESSARLRRGEKVTADPNRFLADVLGNVAGYDYLILDCAPSRDVLNRNALYLANEVIMPVSVDYLASVGAGQHTASIVDAQNAGQKIRLAYVLPTFYDARRILAREVLADLQSFYGQVVSEPIPVNVSLAEAPSFGQTIFEYAPKSTGAAAYGAFVERVRADG